jgi:hypothetical protein
MRFDPIILAEICPNALDDRCRTLTLGGYIPKCRLRLIELGYRAIKPPEPSIGSRYHASQRLLDFVSDRRRDCIAGHESRLALPTLSLHRTCER